MKRPAGLAAILLAASSLAGASEPSPHAAVGFYQWLGVSDRPADLLTEARRHTTAMGSRVFRLYLGCRYDYEHPIMDERRFGGVESLTPVEILSTIDRYRAVLDDPALKTIIFTVYSCANYGGGPDDINLQRLWSDGEEKLVREQIAALASWLYEHYGDRQKTVIFANNETDEKLSDIAHYTGSIEFALENLQAWLRARQSAVAAARECYPNAKLKLFHAVEISLVNLNWVASGNGFYKTPQAGVNTLSHILPEIEFDLVSYSSYESTNSPYETQDPDTPPAEAGRRLVRDLDRIRASIRGSISEAGRGRFGDRFVMIGELGYSRDRFENLATGGVKPRLQAALGAARDWGCPYIVLWQVFDAPKSGGAAWGFGIYDRRGRAPAIDAEPGSCSTLLECMKTFFESGLDAW